MCMYLVIDQFVCWPVGEGQCYPLCSLYAVTPYSHIMLSIIEERMMHFCG